MSSWDAAVGTGLEVHLEGSAEGFAGPVDVPAGRLRLGIAACRRCLLPALVRQPHARTIGSATVTYQTGWATSGPRWSLSTGASGSTFWKIAKASQSRGHKLLLKGCRMELAGR